MEQAEFKILGEIISKTPFFSEKGRVDLFKTYLSLEPSGVAFFQVTFILVHVASLPGAACVRTQTRFSMTKLTL